MTNHPPKANDTPAQVNVDADTIEVDDPAATGTDFLSWPDLFKPQRIEDLIYPSSCLPLLKSWSEKGTEMPHVLIAGQPGIGKTTALDLIVKASGLAPLKINGALDRGIDEVRKIRPATRTMTVFGEHRVIFIDELDGLTAEAFSGLRGDTIAGNSSTSVFVATCNDLRKIPAAIKDRFHVIDLDEEIASHRAELMPAHIQRARDILKQRGVEFDEMEVKKIVEKCFPSVRCWLSALQARAAAGAIRETDIISPVPERDASSKKIVGQRSSSPGDSPDLTKSARTDAAPILDDIEHHLSRFISTSSANLRAMALFVLHTHAHAAASHSPLLWLNSPEKRCGKTTALKMVSHLVPNPLITSNVSVAGMLRAIEQNTPTFLIDEMEHALKATGDLHGILNLGHSPNGLMVRSTGTYSTWGPKVVALIGELPGTLADRSIRIALRRRLPTEFVERFTKQHESEAVALLKRCEHWATADTLRVLEDSDPYIPTELDDRAQDNWRPLIAIADLAGGDWPLLARGAAITISARDDIEEPSPGILILQASRDWFAGNDDAYVPSKILADLAEDMGAVSGKPKSRMIRVARILSGLDVHRGTFRAGSETEKGYGRDQLEDACNRYLANDEAEGA